MTENNQRLYSSSLVRDSNSELNQQLANYAFIDIGVVVSLHGAFATVRSVSKKRDMYRQYTNVEVLFPGGIRSTCVGKPCLLLRPVSCVPNTNTMEISQDRPYGDMGVKAIPVMNNLNDKTDVGVTGNGSFQAGIMTVLGTMLNITSEGTTINIKDGTVNISINYGKISYNITPDGKCSRLIPEYELVEFDGTAVTRSFAWSEDDSKWLYIITYNADGFVLAGENTSVTLTPENITVTDGTNTIELKGDDGTSVTDGTNTIELKGDDGTSVTDGTNTIELKGDDGITMTGASGKVKVTDGSKSLELGSNGFTITDGTNKVESSSSGLVLQGAAGKVEIM